tara:strand:- start:745 stop:1410 length:666 start_codon:yes stop_codon:yes gene_type:complete
MPDLQTALTTAITNANTSQVLSTTINEWEEEEKQTMQAATQPQTQPVQTQIQINGNSKLTLTGNLSKDIFVYIRDNRGCLRADVRKVFMAAGFKEASIGSLVSQMVRNKMVSINEVGNLEAKRVYYKPLVSGTKRKEMSRKLGTARDKPAAKPAKPKAQGIAALAPEPTQSADKGQEALDKVLAKPVREARAVYDALCLLRDLDVGDARYMYTELHKLFGG